MIDKNDLLELIKLRPGISLSEIFFDFSFEFYHGIKKKDKIQIKSSLKELVKDGKIQYVRIKHDIFHQKILFYLSNCDLKIKIGSKK